MNPPDGLAKHVRLLVLLLADLQLLGLRRAKSERACESLCSVAKSPISDRSVRSLASLTCFKLACHKSADAN